jgi:hypothetical protein
MSIVIFMEKNNNKDEVIERLINENSLVNRAVNEAKIELSQFGDIDGMSFLSAIKTIIKKYNNLVNENYLLKEEIKKLTKQIKKKD